jgi:hypothetical protein
MFTSRHSVTYQKTWISSNTAARTVNVAKLKSSVDKTAHYIVFTSVPNTSSLSIRSNVPPLIKFEAKLPFYRNAGSYQSTPRKIPEHRRPQVWASQSVSQSVLQLQLTSSGSQRTNQSNSNLQPLGFQTSIVANYKHSPTFTVVDWLIDWLNDWFAVGFGLLRTGGT